MAGYTIELKGGECVFSLGTEELKLRAIETITLTAKTGDLFVDLTALFFLMSSHNIRVLSLKLDQQIFFEGPAIEAGKVLRACAPGLQSQLEATTPSMNETQVRVYEKKVRVWKLSAVDGLRFKLLETRYFISFDDFLKRLSLSALVIHEGETVQIESEALADRIWKNRDDVWGELQNMCKDLVIEGEAKLTAIVSVNGKVSIFFNKRASLSLIGRLPLKSETEECKIQTLSTAQKIEEIKLRG